MPTSGIAEGTIYAKGPTYAADDTSNNNPIYRLWVYAWKGNTLAWQDNGEFQSITAGIVQETGYNKNAVMSQKATTEKLTELASQAIYDVSANNDGATFDSLSTLLSSENLSILIPTAVRCGGMNIRFVQSSDNKYVQYRLMSNTFNTTVANWQGVDEEPVVGSRNLLESGKTASILQKKISIMDSFDDSDLNITDDYGNVLIRSKNGGIQTKNFDSSKSATSHDSDDDSDLDITDIEGNVLLKLKGGHIQTKNFNSKQIRNKEPYLLQIVVLGQSLSLGYDTSYVLNKVDTDKAFMFKQVRSQDFGYIFNINKNTYNNNQPLYDESFYKINELLESGGNGYNSAKWETASNNEYETPCSGIVEGILKSYQYNGLGDLPFKVLCSASGIGGTAIEDFNDDSDKIINRTKRDILHGMQYAASQNIAYRLLLVWIQGESNMSSTIEYYKAQLKNVYDNILSFLSSIGYDTNENHVKMVSYQTTTNPSSYYATKTNLPALAQMEADKEYEWFKMAYPIYNLQPASDYVHLTNISSRIMGNTIGNAIFKILNGDFETLKITSAEKDGNNIICRFNKSIISDYSHLNRDGYTTAQNNEVQANLGFYVYDVNNNNVLTSVTLENNTIKIVCSAEPSVLFYGTKGDEDVTIGGTIREEETIDGYNNSKVYLYMPVQKITSFTNKFNY